MPKRRIQKYFETFKFHHLNGTKCLLLYLSDKTSDASFVVRQIYVLILISSRFRNVGRGVETSCSREFYTPSTKNRKKSQVEKWLFYFLISKF